MASVQQRHTRALPRALPRTGYRIDRERHLKLEQLRREDRDPFPDAHLPTRLQAREVHTLHDPQLLTPGEHPRWRYAVAGRVVARRKHAHATFLDLRDESGVIELCVKRERRDDPPLRALRGADLGDVVCAEGIVYVTDNARLTLSAASAELLAKALRSLPTKPSSHPAHQMRPHQRALALMTDERLRARAKAKAAASLAIREWMASALFLELDAEGGSRSAPASKHSSSLSRLAECMLAGFERVYQLHATSRLDCSVAYTDHRALAREIEVLIRHLAAAMTPRKPIGPATWRTITVREAISARCAIDILAANPAELARHLPFYAQPEDHDWDSLVNELYTHLVEPELIEPTIVCDFPLNDRPSVRRHSEHAALASDFRIVIAATTVASGNSQLTDPHEQLARLSSQPSAQAQPELADPYVRLLEHGLCPAAGATLWVEQLLTLLLADD